MSDQVKRTINPAVDNDFCYPLRTLQLHALREDLLCALYALIQDNKVNEAKRNFLLINTHVLIVEVMSLFLADILLQKGTKEQIESYAPARFLRQGKAIPDISYFDIEGTDPLWKKCARYLRSRLISAQIPYIPRAWNKKEHTLTFITADLLLAHQKAHGDIKLVRNEIREWVNPEETGPYKKDVLEVDFQEQLVKMITTICRKHGALWDEALQKHVTHRLQYLAFYTFAYMAQIESKAHSFPHQFWTGSAGQMIYRIMALVARRHGCKVFGHDHGSGFGWLDTEYQTIIDFNFVDTFVTYTPLMEEGLKNTIKTEFLCNKDFTADDIVHYKLDKNAAVFPEPQSGRDIKTILFIGNTYMKDRSNLYPWMFCDVAKDFHIRLFSTLEKDGLRIIFRPHPDEREKDLSFISDLGIEIDQSPTLQEACERADAVMLDISTATSLIDVLKMGIRAILLDVEQMGTITPKARIMMAKTFLHKVLEYDELNLPIIPDHLAEDIRSFEYFQDSDLNFVQYHVDRTN